MNADFKNIMSKRTDEELIRIVTADRDSYQSPAVEAAEKEIENRGMDLTNIDKMKADWTIKIEEQKQFDAKKVGSSTRFIHFIVDTIAFYIVTYILSFILFLFINPTDQSLLTSLGYLLLATGFFGYYIFMETKYQKTIGKIITKTSVVTKDGSKPEVDDIVKRTFYRLMPLDGISFLFTPNGFHDRLSGTTIIKDEN